MTNPSGPTATYSSTGWLLSLIFKTLMWLNGLGIASILVVALGLIPAAVSPYWLRLPLAMFLAGMLLSILGLFWSGMLQAALMRQCLAGYARRSHWIPALFAMVSYFFAFVAFAAACWAFLGVASLSHYHDDIHRGLGHGGAPHFHPQNWQDGHSNIKYTHCA